MLSVLLSFFCYMQVITDFNIPGITFHIKYGIQYWSHSDRSIRQWRTHYVQTGSGKAPNWQRGIMQKNAGRQLEEERHNNKKRQFFFDYYFYFFFFQLLLFLDIP